MLSAVFCLLFLWIKFSGKLLISPTVMWFMHLLGLARVIHFERGLEWFEKDYREF
jgi:hypothetical protein